MQLIKEGKVKDDIFIEDVYFKSTSSAASCVTGGSVNGNAMWLYPDGKSIKGRLKYGVDKGGYNKKE